MYDYGRNFSGWTRLRVTAPAGTRIVMRFGEMLNPDGTVYRKNLRAARATDTYVCKGGGEETWEPRFTYHGFQYVEVEGLPETAGPETLTGIIVGSALPLTGMFECSDAIMTRTAANERCTIRANLVELPTDCPQRDERMGWTDYHEVVASTLYEQDAATLLTKWMGRPGRCALPGRGISDDRARCSPLPVVAGMGGQRRPHSLDDVFRVRRHPPGLRGITMKSPGILRRIRRSRRGSWSEPIGLGDWLAPDMSTPKELIATALYARCAEVMAEMARALGKAEDAAAFADLHRSIRAAFQTEVHRAGRNHRKRLARRIRAGAGL